MDRPKRVFPGPEGVTLTIRITDGPESPAPLAFSRQYDDGHGLIEVVRRNPHPGFAQFAESFRYNGESIADVVPVFRGSYFANTTTEMVGCARVLSMLGCRDAQLSPREPREPDIHVRHADLGEFYIEFTLGIDPEEREFQEGIKQIAMLIADRLGLRHEAWLHERGVTLAFVSVPKRRAFPALADELAALIVRTEGSGGTHEVTDPRVAARMPSFQITIGGKVGVSAAGLPLERGIADYAAIAEQRIATKRDTKYETNGLPLWVGVGLALPIIKPDFMGAIFHKNLELRHLARVVVADSTELVDFRRVLN